VGDADLGRNFGGAQVLQSDTGNRDGDCVLYRKWGRIGTPIRGNKTDHLPATRATDEFERLFEEKTGNLWAERERFVQVRLLVEESRRVV
jgi:hypothetical protein